MQNHLGNKDLLYSHLNDNILFKMIHHQNPFSLFAGHNQTWQTIFTYNSLYANHFKPLCCKIILMKSISSHNHFTITHAYTQQSFEHGNYSVKSFPATSKAIHFLTRANLH